MTVFTRDDLVVGRVLNEDDGFMLLEIAKSERRSITIQEGDRFFTVAFIRMNDDGVAEVWKPWTP